jgi:hypothetical protein
VTPAARLTALKASLNRQEIPAPKKPGASGRRHNRRIAVLATDGVEQVELTEPARVLKEASAQVAVIAPHGGQI